MTLEIYHSKDEMINFQSFFAPHKKNPVVSRGWGRWRWIWDRLRLDGRINLFRKDHPPNRQQTTHRPNGEQAVAGYRLVGFCCPTCGREADNADDDSGCASPSSPRAMRRNPLPNYPS